MAHQHWVRYRHAGETGFGTLHDGRIQPHAGDLFAAATPKGSAFEAHEATLLTPCEPNKMIGLVNNFHALLTKLNAAVPEEPLYFLKSQTAFLAAGETIETPVHYSGRVVFEGELGIVIGKRAKNVEEADALSYVFGYTCVNDVTAFDLLNKDPQFAQWTRAKSFDTFGVIGPSIATGLDPGSLVVRTILEGDERQNYPISDMVFSAARLVSLLSKDMTLLPGDVIACGTSVGAGRMKPGSTIEIEIEGIGRLTNRFEGVAAEVTR
ncbi:MAG: fumarylacetoacetate hydrolase family protein [Candidatus Eremiobacteraeota bacterium]|nr:fumarylacetoacetate hydrolase family protein [Candidatus Eremiobacteraeota bacterium]